jgi:hypothetical protein
MSGSNGAGGASQEFVKYHFRHAIGGFFEFPTANARKILPPHLHPVEPHHGQSVLSVMAFDFHESMVGEYGELILSVLVMPRVEPGALLPRSAFYPFLLGTTTKAARDHAIARWHLPHFMENIDLSFDAQADEIRIAAAHGGRPIIDMRITDYDWEKVSHRYQCFMHDADGSYMSEIVMDADFSENEEERGDITIHPHAVTAAIDRDGVNTMPFRELWMRDGLQTFHPLETLATAAV